MRYSLRTAWFGVTVVCLLLALGFYSLRTGSVDTASSGNICSFDDADSAHEAANLKLRFTFRGLDIETVGLFSAAGGLGPNETNFEVRITGNVKRTMPELQNQWPFTAAELTERIESEIENNLTQRSKCKFIHFTVSLSH